MRLTYTTRFEVISTYAEKDIPKRAGFRWDPKGRTWWTADKTAAMMLASYADESAKRVLDETVETLEASRATGAEIEIPVPEGREMFSFQRAGVKFAASRPATLIGDVMGLGKTIQAIGLLNADPSLRKVLIVAPLSVKLNWRNEIRQWSIRDLSIGIADAKTWPEEDVVIIHPDVLTRHVERLHSISWDLVVLDEAHLYKSSKAQRSQVIFGTKDKDKIKARKKLALTGTPIPNRPVEIYPILRWLDPETWGSWMRFVTRYCAGHEGKWGWDVSGASNLAELQQRLRSTVMIRRRKEDVLTELPPKIRQIITLDPEDIMGGTEAIEAEIRAAIHADELVALAKAAIDSAETDEAYQTGVARLKAAQIAFDSMSYIRHQTALVKVPAVAQHVRDLLEGGVEKVGVWAHHRDVIAQLVEALQDFSPVSIVGGDTPDARAEAVRRFQEDETCRVFVGSIQAAGVGITLTAASTAVFAELDWVPGNISQAEDRHHRIGTTENVSIQHIVIDGSIDARLAKTLIAKQGIIDKALDDPATLTEPIILPAPVKTRRQEEIEQLAETLTPEQIEVIHAGLRILAAYDADHAQIQNGIGFSKLDVSLGHDLATRKTLTPKQAALGQMLVRKYRRQLPAEIIQKGA